MVNWLKRLWLWFKELSHFWLSLVVLLPLISYAFLPTLEETRLRIAGLVLQLCGIGTVARGISQTRQLFGHPSIVESSLQWLRRFPSFRPKAISGSGHISGGGIKFSGHGEVSSKLGPTASLEARVSDLERRLTSVNLKVDELQNHVDTNVRKLKELIDDERVSRGKDVHELYQKLEHTETGGLRLSLVGLIWLCCGLVMSTIPNEIAKFF